MSAVIDPTWDAVTVAMSRALLTSLVEQGHPVDMAGEFVAEHLADTLAIHRAGCAS